MAETRLVPVATFDNEPLARMWEERLYQEGIPCVARVLGVGPGGWGQTSALPYALWVPAEAAITATGLITQASPEEIVDHSHLDDDSAPWSPLTSAPLFRTLAGAILFIFLTYLLVSLVEIILL